MVHGQNEMGTRTTTQQQHHSLKRLDCGLVSTHAVNGMGWVWNPIKHRRTKTRTNNSEQLEFNDLVSADLRSKRRTFSFRVYLSLGAATRWRHTTTKTTATYFRDAYVIMLLNFIMLSLCSRRFCAHYRRSIAHGDYINTMKGSPMRRNSARKVQ